MFRYVVPAVILLSSPAFAGGDDFLKKIFDADGPAITHQVADEPTQSCDTFYHELPVTDPCSGWVQTGEADFGNGPQPVYGNLDDIDETDTGDPRCPPERSGMCPELLSPEDYAAWAANNPLVAETQPKPPGV
jgi:hypothetical protein